MSDVTICECFARDGLQHEPDILTTDTKVAVIDRFARMGFTRIEATSYAHPKVIPQFADATELLRALPRRPGVHYKATCPNVRAVQRAVADLEAGCGATEVSLLTSASETHSMRNLRRTREAQWQNIEAMAEEAAGRFRLVGTISVAFGCPFEGAVDARTVAADAQRFSALGVHLVALGDTTGLASPRSVRSLVDRIRDSAPEITIIAHFHDTRGSALANYCAALEYGVDHFDSAFGGVGGHPARVQYGEGHTGNAATEDLVSLFESMGVNTGIDLVELAAASKACEAALGRELNARVARAGPNPLTGR